MMGTLALTIRQLLETPCFSKASVIAGEQGLERVVRWVHVMDVPEIGSLLNGNELILSTGVSWDSPEKEIDYLQQLIDEGASGLCVELCKYRHEISSEMIELANEHHFPIIIFHREVKFIDITQSINMCLMNNQYKILTDLEEFSRKLNQTLLLPNAFKRVLNLLYEHLNVQVVYLSKNRDEVIFAPVLRKMEQEYYLKLVESHKKERIVNQNKQFQIPSGVYAGQSIQTLGHKFAELIIFPQDKVISEVDLVVLDRCATAISQDLLRIFYVEEQNKYKEIQWIKEWLDGELSTEQIDKKLQTITPAVTPIGATVCVCELSESIDESTYSYYKTIFRNIFQNSGLYLYTVDEQKELYFILLNLRDEHWKNRTSQAINQILQTDLFKHTSPTFGVGKYTTKLHRLSESFQTAKESLKIQNKLQMTTEIFYENLHIFLLVSSMDKYGQLEDYMFEYIGEVIEHDKNHNSELLKTLAVFLESNGSKKVAAKKLFVVRQTLYHRLDKLKDLLGADFMVPSKRTAIEFALYAYQYLNTNDKKGVNLKAIL